MGEDGLIQYQIILSTVAANNTSSLNNANTAEAMTALGIYVHAFFLVLALGLPFLVLTLEGLGIVGKDRDYTRAAKSISQVWAVSFGFGAITGTLVEFGLYVIWPGTILAISSFWFLPFMFDLFAFLIEVSFLVAYLYLWNRLGNPWQHWLLGLGILVGSVLSAYSILAANSWMQVPWGTGQLISGILPWVPTLGSNSVNQTAFSVLSKSAANTGVLNLGNPQVAQSLGYLLYNPWVVLLNPDAFVTSAHTILAAIIVSSYGIAAIFSYSFLKGNVALRSFYLKIMKVAYGAGGVAMFFEAFAGDLMARAVYSYRAIQLLAFEGIPRGGGLDPIIGLLLYGNPSHFFPGFDYYNSMASLSVSASAVTQSVAAIEQVEPLLHALYYTMVFSGVALTVFGVAFFGLYSKRIDKLVRFVTRMSTEKFIIYSSFVAPLIALLAGASGWAIREVGRHPWTVYGLIQYWQVVTPNPITSEFSYFMIGVEILVFIGGLLALYYIPIRLLKEGKDEVLIHS